MGRGYTDDVLHDAKLAAHVAAREARCRPAGDARRVDPSSILGDALRPNGAGSGVSPPSSAITSSCTDARGALPPLRRRPPARSYEDYEVTYCPTCQTGGKILADRRLCVCCAERRRLGATVLDRGPAPHDSRPDPPPRLGVLQRARGHLMDLTPLKVSREFRLLFFGHSVSRTSVTRSSRSSCRTRSSRSPDSTLAVGLLGLRGADPGVRVPDHRRDGSPTRSSDDAFVHR